VVTEARAFHLTPSRAADRVNVRLMSATDHDLWPEISAGRFREDLYYRLNEIVIHVPPLGDRRDDIVLLCAQYLAHAADAHG